MPFRPGNEDPLSRLNSVHVCDSILFGHLPDIHSIGFTDPIKGLMPFNNMISAFLFNFLSPRLGGAFRLEAYALHTHP